jgi:two-component system, cell cycle response regulator DivK
MNRKLKILIMEDNSDNAELLSYILRDIYKHEVDHAWDGEEGLKMAQAKEYDLLIIDIRMPIMGGYEVIRLIRGAQDSMLRRVIAVACTASAFSVDKNKIMQEGFDGYLMKPIEPESLHEQIKAFTRDQTRWVNPRVLGGG